MDASSIIRGVVVPVFVGVSLALLRRYLPAPKPKIRGSYSVVELDGQFAYATWIVNIAMIAVGTLLAIGLYKVLLLLNHSFGGEADAKFVVRPVHAIWWFLPGFGAVCASWDIVLGVWALSGAQKEAELFRYCTSAKAGYDATRALRAMLIFVCLPIAIATCLAIPMHSVFGSTEMHFRDYASLTTAKYSYSDIRLFAVVDGYRDRDGRFHHQPTIVLHFRDGRIWTSNPNKDLQNPIDPMLVEYLGTKTGLSVVHAEAEANLPPAYGASFRE